MQETIIQNAVRVHNTIYKSANRHDFVKFVDELGQEGFIDGGTDYIRSGGNWTLNPFKHGVIDMNLYTDSPTSDILNKLVWGTFGVSSNQPLVWKPIRDLDLPHLESILKGQPKLSPLTIQVIEYWIAHHKQMIAEPPTLER